MKTSTLKSLFVAIALMLVSVQAFSQVMVSTRIDVQGSRYSDQMWVFAVPTCTRDFDNGWDAFKMFGNVVTPQIFAWEANGNFQIDAVPDMNNTYIGFQAGEDTVYTFTFNNEYVETMYTQLYLIDSVANKTVSILATGTKYTFSVKPTAAPVKRFKIVTSLPVVATTPTPTTDPVVTTPVPDPVVVTDPIVTTPVTDPVVVVPTPDPVVTPGTTVTPDSKDKKDKKDKKLKITNKKNVLVVENSGKQKGKLALYSSATGKKVKDFDFNANGTTNLNHNLSKGTYIVKGQSSEDEITENIIIQ